jgi:hypothetical protein
MELYKVYWRQKAGNHSAEVRSPVSVSFLYLWSCYEDFLKFLKRRTLHSRRLYIDALYFISVYSGLKCCRSLLVITGIRELSPIFRKSSQFTSFRSWQFTKTHRTWVITWPLCSQKIAIDKSSCLLIQIYSHFIRNAFPVAMAHIGMTMV